MSAYYNENDKKAAAWLRELIRAGLIAPGEVDERSITDVRHTDLQGFTQCHFFAGIGGWSYALRLAGWPDDREVWTGSCPCQKYSTAARGRNVAEDAWPLFRELIFTSRPGTVFGEQVAAARAWLDSVRYDVEAMAYAFGAAVLPACSVGQDHVGERIFFVCSTNSESKPGCAIDEEMARLSRTRGHSSELVPTNGISHRMALLRGFGNAIVPQVAAEFIAAYCEAVASDGIQETHSYKE